jgi:hypothetical protein
MINIPTVLVLGAGASTNFGYPLGMELIAKLLRLRETSTIDAFPKQWDRNDINAFLTRLGRSGHYSIDAFLETDLEYAALGKYLIAYELKQYESIDRLFPPNNSGWYQYLFNCLISDGVSRFSENKLGIITFNYDRSLEAYLHTALQNRFRMAASEAEKFLKVLPIVHVHGILGKFPEIPYNGQRDFDHVLEISQQIQIIHEMSDQDGKFCNEMFEQAHEMLASAQKIFFLGFGFHRDNVRRFRFFEPENIKGKMLKATTLGLGTLERESLVKRLADSGFTIDTFPVMGINCEEFFRHIALLE